MANNKKVPVTSWSEFMKEFHKRFDLPIDAKLEAKYMAELIDQRNRPMEEEWREVVGAVELLKAAYDAKMVWPDRVDDNLINKYREEALKEFADLIYTVVSFCLATGLDIDKAFVRVHNNNMAKIWPDGKVHRNEHGKVLKPEGHKVPSLADLV